MYITRGGEGFDWIHVPRDGRVRNEREAAAEVLLHALLVGARIGLLVVWVEREDLGLVPIIRPWVFGVEDAPTPVPVSIDP